MSRHVLPIRTRSPSAPSAAPSDVSSAAPSAAPKTASSSDPWTPWAALWAVPSAALCATLSTIPSTASSAPSWTVSSVYSSPPGIEHEGFSAWVKGIPFFCRNQWFYSQANYLPQSITVGNKSDSMFRMWNVIFVYDNSVRFGILPEFDSLFLQCHILYRHIKRHVVLIMAMRPLESTTKSHSSSGSSWAPDREYFHKWVKEV